MLVRFKVLFLLVFFYHISLLGQSSANFERFSTLNGLPQNSIFSIAQDSKGFIWFATYDGLSRFDGYQFIAFKPDPGNLRGISSNITVTLASGADDKLWVGTTGSGFSVFDTKFLLFKNYLSEVNSFNSLSDNDITSIRVMGDYVFIGTTNGLNVFITNEERILSFSTQHGLAANYIHSVFSHQDGEVWLSTSEGIQLVALENNQLISKRIWPLLFTNGVVSQIIGDKEGRLWMVTDRHITCFNIDSNSNLKEVYKLSYNSFPKELPGNIQFNTICQRDNGEFWVGTQSGLLKLTEKDGIFNLSDFFINNVNDESSIPGNQIISLYTDNEGILWVGTRFSGLAKYDPYKQHIFRYMHNPSVANTIHSNDVRAISEDSNGNIWIGFRNQGLNYINAATGIVKYFDSGNAGNDRLLNNSIRALYLDQSGKLWVGYYGGFAKVEIDSRDNVRFIAAKDDTGSIIRFNGTTYAFYEDSNQNFWVGTSFGLLLYNRHLGKAEWVRNSHSHIPWGRSNFIRSVCEDFDGNLWLATDGNGVYRYNHKTGQFRNYSQILGNPATISHNKVYSIVCDYEGKIWIGTHSGLNLFDAETETFTHFTQDNGLSNNIVYGIMPEKGNVLWLSTANGLSKFNSTNRLFKTFLPGFEFSDDAYSQNHIGRIYVGGLNGFFTFHPDSLKENPFIPPIRFTQLRLYNVPVEVGPDSAGRTILPVALSHLDELVLNYSDTFFSIEFTALSYATPSQNQYQFKLNGLHSQWIPVDYNNRQAVFTRLAPGNYTLMVRGSNSDGLWGESSIKIRIIPAYYQTQWFKWVTVLLFAVMIFMIYRARLRALTKQKIKLQQIVDDKTKTLQRQNQLLSEQRNEIASQRDRVVEMTRLVREADERKLRFFTGISHEIRTPLTLILGPLEQLLSSSDLEIPVKEKLLIVQRNSASLLKLMAQLLDFRKIDSGLMPLNPHTGDLKTFIIERLDMFKPLIEAKRLQLEIHIPNQELNCLFDADVVEKVLFNLMSNGVKYTPENGYIKVVVDTETRPSGKFLKVEVSDSGTGISASPKSKVFERFYRDSVKKNKADGAGIGLALSRELARLHGGDLIVDESFYPGSRFVFSFPYHESGLSSDYNDVNSVEFNVEDNTDSLSQFSKNDFTILVIEDNDDLRRFIGSGLQLYNVLLAGDGDEGLKIAREQLPDLIVSDIMMPNKNGFEICREIKGNDATNHIPVILLTALGSLEHQQLGIDYGADDYIVKPFSISILAGKIRNILNARQNFRKQLLAGLTGNEAVAVSQTQDPFLSKVIEVIKHQLCDETFGVEELGQLMNMSRSTFYRKIKTLTGITPVELIRMVRLKRSSEILKESPEITINEVAFKVGFEDVNYFRECFKKQFGKAPRDFM